MSIKNTFFLAFIFCFTGIYAQEILFSENFDDCVLSEKWTYSLAGNQNAVWGVGIPSNSNAEGLSINGSCMLYIDDDLTGDKTAPFKLRVQSSWFDGSGFSDLVFKALVHFRRDKTEVLRIFIHNGKDEHLVREFRNTNYSGAKFTDFVRVNADISFIATDSMSIIIEYDDDNVWGWWAGIDDLEVSGIKGGEIVLGQNFNSCVLPQEWQTEILSGIDDWQFGFFTNGQSIDGSCFIYFNDDILGQNNPLSKIRLYSPTFDASLFSDYVLTYDLTYRTYEPTEYLQLYVDNGSEWIPVKTYTTDFGGPEIQKSKRDTVNLSAFRSENIRLIWEYSDGGWAWWVGMDNIKVTGSGSANDRCRKAVNLSLDDECLTFDNTNALSTTEPGLPEFKDALGFLYFKPELNTTAFYTITTISGFNDRIELFRGSCDEAVRVATVNRDEYGFHGEKLIFHANIDSSYFIRISGYQDEFGFSTGTGCIRIDQEGQQPLSPDTDKCQQAVTLLLDQGCTPFFNLNAEFDGPAPSDNIRSRADIWYKFTPPAGGDFSFLSEADFSESLAVYTGSCNEKLEIVSAYAGQKIDIRNAIAQTDYFIQVSGYFSTMEGSVCAKIISIPTVVPVNDDCITAVAVPLNSSCNNYSNKGGTPSGIRLSCDVYSDADLWFSFVANASGTVYLRARAEFEYILSVFEGSCVSLKSVYCDNQAHHCKGYTTISGLASGKTYYVMIGAKRVQTGSITGNVCLEILEQNPMWEKLQLEVTQECVSKGAVLFKPETSGGSGEIVVVGPGIELPAAGGHTYYLEAMDEDGCIAAKPVQAGSCNEFGCTVAVNHVRTNTSCFGVHDGSINLDITGGLGQYEVIWSNGMEGTTITNLAAGSYTATVSDGSGCELSNTYIISQPAQILTNYDIKSPKCNGDSTAQINLFVTGGSSPYNYLWSNGSSSDKLSGIRAGSYTLHITDRVGCTLLESFTIGEPEALVFTSTITDIICPGEATGSISISVKGGTIPHSISWENGDHTGQLNNLTKGTYLITITDAHQCQVLGSVNLHGPDPFEILTEFADLTITDENPAQIKTNVKGGTQPYEFMWIIDGEHSANDRSDIITDNPGVYQLQITDSAGCKFLSDEWIINKVSATDNTQIGSHVKIFPNPVTDLLSVKFNHPMTPTDIRISNTDGKILYKIDDNNVSNDILIINTSRFAFGYYTITWTSGMQKYSAGFIKVN